MSVASTSGILLTERNSGILERLQATSIKYTEIVTSHIVTQFSIMCLQTILVIFFAFLIFGLKKSGAVFWVLVLAVLCGLCGICFGNISKFDFDLILSSLGEIKIFDNFFCYRVCYCVLLRIAQDRNLPNIEPFHANSHFMWYNMASRRHEWHLTNY